MHHLKIGLLAGAVFGGMFMLFMGMLAGGWRSGKASAYTHMHCTECAFEVTYNPVLEGKPCPQCGVAGPKMIATVGPKTDKASLPTGDIWSFGNIFAAIVLALAATTSSFYAWILWTGVRGRAADKARNQIMACPCPICSRKIGYPARDIGKTGFCSRCKTAFILPEGELVESS